MSEADHQATSVLLPSSSVAVFSKDRNTLESAKKIEDDWRFARVNLQIEEGDVFTAIEAYEDVPSPDLIIIQTENIGSELPAQLEQLANNCDEGTGAIVIGPDNDVGLYRRLIDMGVSDYLVKPVTADFLAEVVAKALIDKIGVTGSRLIAFVGAKGGVGVSAIAQATAWGVADILEQKVMFVDTAGGWSTTAVGMGFEPTTSLQEAVRAAENSDEDNLRRMLFMPSERLSVLATGGEPMLESAVDAQEVETLLDTLMMKYPVVFVDLSHGAVELEKAVIGRANQIIVVTTPTITALRLARTLVQEVKALRGGNTENVELIVNMQGVSSGDEVPKKDIEAAMELNVSAFVPFAPKVFIGSESASRKLTEDKEGVHIVKNTLLPLLSKSLDIGKNNIANDADTDSTGLIGGVLKKLKTKKM